MVNMLLPVAGKALARLARSDRLNKVAVAASASQFWTTVRRSTGGGTVPHVPYLQQNYSIH